LNIFVKLFCVCVCVCVCVRVRVRVHMCHCSGGQSSGPVGVCKAWTSGRWSGLYQLCGWSILLTKHFHEGCCELFPELFFISVVLIIIILDTVSWASGRAAGL